MRDYRPAIDAIEAELHEEVGRNLAALFAASRGALFDATESMAAIAAPRVGLITGFFIPRAPTPAAETDGPVGTALLARGLVRAGCACRVATDEPCVSACRAALDAAGMGEVPIDIVPLAGTVDEAIGAWRASGITHAIAIERCGRSADGRPRNVRGIDIGAHTALLDDLFAAGPWTTIAVGDLGNEVGMGGFRPLVIDNVVHGESLACVTTADHPIVAGVSNWGAYALLGALALRRADWRDAMLGALDIELDLAVLKATVENGPAVDGVSHGATLTVDGLPLERHQRKLRAIRAIVEANL